MANGFAGSGIVVGQTPRSNRERRHDHLKGNKVTMGKNVPRQSEGAVGDITVRDISTVGLRCYIKTDSGWYDIHALKSPFVLDWRDIIFEPSGVSSWISNENVTSGERAQFAKDQNGIVHLRGSIICLRVQDTSPTTGEGNLSGAWETGLGPTEVEQSGSDGPGTGMVVQVRVNAMTGAPVVQQVVTMGTGHVSGNVIEFTDPGNTDETCSLTISTTSATVTTPLGTLPPGYRPYGYVVIPSSPFTGSRALSLKIAGTGVMTPTSYWDEDLSFLDGMSFVAKQVIHSTAQGGASGGGSGGTTT